MYVFIYYYLAINFILFCFILKVTIFFCIQRNNNELPDNKTISSALGKKESLKKYIKRAMPFAQMVKEKLIKIGDSAFNVKLEFSEKHVLEVNKSYLENTLDVSSHKT